MKLMLLEPSEIFRIGLRTCLAELRPDLKVVAELESADEERITSASPDLLVTEMSLPGTNAVALCRRLRTRAPSIRVAILTNRAPPSVVRQALAAGIRGYVTKTRPAHEIARVLARIAEGVVIVPAASAPPASNSHGSAGSLLDRLSRREREVFELAALGYGNAAIAGELAISIKTVETHRWHIHRKLGLHTAADLVRFASFYGVLDGTDPTRKVPAAVDGRPAAVDGRQ